MKTNKVVVVIAFLLAAGVGFAQGARGMGGGGISGQPIDGTVIKPRSVQASGSGDQFMCTATTAVCEVESSISAATMTSTVPAFDIGPTATPGANDRLACFSYGPSGSKTRVACVDTEGDFNVSGNMVLPNTFLCMNSACTTYWRTEPTFGDVNLLRNNTQIMYVNGVPALNIVVPTSAIQINSTVASGSQAFTCSNVGCRLSLGSTSRYIFDDAGNGVARFEGWGLSTTGNIFTASGGVNATSGNPLNLSGSPADGATAVATILRSQASYSTSGAKLLSVRNLNSEVSFIDYLGNYSGNGFVATTASGSSLTGGGASGPLLLTSNTPDSHTSTTVPAFLLKPSTALTSGDAVFQVQSSAGADEFRIRGGAGAGGSAQAIIGGGVGRFSGQTLTNFTGELTLDTWRTAASNVTGVSIGSFYALTGDQTKVLSIRNGSNFATEIAHFSKDGLLRVNQANAAKPTCNADNRGRIFFLDGASGAADVFEVCGKDATNAYSWKSIVTW